jgi:hypothetical protein
VSNFQYPYRTTAWNCAPLLDLADYLGHERDLADIARPHQAQARGYGAVLKVPFFCIKIPHAIQVTVGELDERFRRGAEDDDYCVRCQRAGFPVLFALDSYVLHFQGKSTWRGAETVEEKRRRDQDFLTAFGAKWGRRLLDVVLLGKLEVVQANPEWCREWNRGNFRWVIDQLLRAEENDVGEAWPRSGTSADACGYGVPRAFAEKPSRTTPWRNTWTW